MSIKYIDMFAGIGGFRSGLEKVGGFECVGYCEIDKYAKKAYDLLYDTKGEIYFDDARKIKVDELPDIDLICGGFPCQSFSVAGARRGFEDVRGTLFFEIARIAKAKEPKYLFLENVPGLLSHDGGRTFKVILNTLDDLGYDVTWNVLNSSNFGVPQSRKRVFIIGYNRKKCSGQILSFTETNPKTLIQRATGSEGNRTYSSKGLSCTLTSGAGGFGGKSGLYSIEDFGIAVKVCTKDGYQIAYPGDSINAAFLSNNTRRSRVGKQLSNTLTTTPSQTYYFIDMNPNPKVTQLARCVKARYDSGIGNHKGESSGVFMMNVTKEELDEILSEEKETLGIIFEDKESNIHIGMIRKLTPRECLRLQGFTDEQIDKLINAGFSDSRLYKMAGNAVTVPVISAIGKKILEVEEYNRESEVIK